MIQLIIPEGPKIPEKLWKASVNNELVLFCGAGISKKNGLPSFSELVEKIYKDLLNRNINDDSLAKDFMKKGKYDEILNLIEGEKEHQVSQKKLRTKIIDILDDYKDEPEIHKSLLELSALPDKKGHRLVTTNFDRLFFEAGLKSELSDSAPRLIPPRKETWNNLTFLHGVIDKRKDPEGINLVLTTKDFGLAYLYDSWASRFIIQLFQNFTVLFIGYSLDDPVMKYIMSAINYENKKKNNQNKNECSTYAFVGRKEEENLEEKKRKWEELMGITPIFYKVKDKDHSLLYETIKIWAELKRDLEKRESWLRDKVRASYDENKNSDREKAKSVTSLLKVDEKLIRVLPEINPDISWLNPISENELLDKFIKPNYEGYPFDDFISLWEPLSNNPKYNSNSILYIADWLCHHLDKRELIHWIIDQNCILHPLLKKRIKREIESGRKNKQLLNKENLLFWKTITSANYEPQKTNSLRIDKLIEELNNEYCVIKIYDLLQCLGPYVLFEKHIYFDPKDSEFNKIYKIDLESKYDNWPTKNLNEEILLRHAEDFTDLLKKTMEKISVFNIGDGYPCVLHRPSIADHEKNTNFHPWCCIIELTRNSFDLAIEKNKELSDFLLGRWKIYPYPVFYRLILYAVTNHSNIDENVVLKLFKNQESHVLWLLSCKNEISKYLKKRKHSDEALKILFSLIVEGPPRSLFRENVSDNEFERSKKLSIYHRLNRLKKANVNFPKEIEKYYNEIQKQYSSETKNMQDESNDFPFYIETFWVGEHSKLYNDLSIEEIYNSIKDRSPYDKAR